MTFFCFAEGITDALAEVKSGAGHTGHLIGDVPALALVAVILAVLAWPLRKA